jgi:hypothetical protein
LQHPYLVHLLALLQGRDAAPTILDYGCGTGLVGTCLLQMGYAVDFAEMPSRSLDFLAWRLRRLRFTGTQIFTLGSGHLLGRRPYDIVWCCDVLEHVPPDQQQALLLQLELLGETVICNLIDDPQADSQVHYPVDIAALTAWIQARRRCVTIDYHAGRIRLCIIGKWASHDS